MIAIVLLYNILIFNNALKRLFVFLNFFFVYGLFNITVAMTPEEALKRMRYQGNLYPRPLYKDDALIPENVLNRYWQRLGGEGLPEKYLALDAVMRAGSLLLWTEQRRHLAAACLIGATEDPSCAISADDLQLTQVYLSRGIDLTKRLLINNFEPIELARSVAMAQLLFSYKASPPETLHSIMKPGFEPELIQLYVQKGTKLNATKCDSLGRNITAFEQLLLDAKLYKENIIEAVKKVALLRECGVDFSLARDLITKFLSIQRINKFISKDDLAAIEKVLTALLEFLKKPQLYREVCIQEFAGTASIITAIYKRELGINK